ncbi:hypothetical protein Plano_1431 [Planococcus sp. PAMC 21323]|uniref:DUF2247 family protein n=1 Tax=Planococcus sp. PAMC 21323 TaxID=1526927 RepID=UPI00056E9E8F|nr:DUF2247 family protein [Planococcus sp. PAMC 21323]AIY05396.1 hypothetical protein Plano_1431 [Planococcus sp. PAMC 21323]
MSEENEQIENSLRIKIPLSFIEELVLLNWEELYMGIKWNYVSPEAAIEKAIKYLDFNDSEDIIGLASLYSNEISSVNYYLTKILSNNKSTDIKEIQEKWLYLVISWLRKNHANYNIIYAEVNYPIKELFEKISVVWDDFKHPESLGKIFYNQEVFDNQDFQITEANNTEDFNVFLNNYLSEQSIRFKK